MEPRLKLSEERCELFSRVPGYVSAAKNVLTHFLTSWWSPYMFCIAIFMKVLWNLSGVWKISPQEFLYDLSMGQGAPYGMNARSVH